jgi:DNA polymerase I
VDELAAALGRSSLQRGDLVGLTHPVRAGGPFTVAAGGGEWQAPAAAVALAEQRLRPRWAVWSQDTARALTEHGIRLATCWDVAAVHRLMFGGWRADPELAWARLHGQPPPDLPARPGGPPDLFSSAGDEPGAPALGAAEALAAAQLQQAVMEGEDATRISTARSESTVELLCAELSADGLPVSRAAAEDLLAQLIGPRPRSPADTAASRAERDERVLRHAPDRAGLGISAGAGAGAGLRSPGQVKSLLAAAGIEVPDTRAWRLEAFRDTSPLVAALLEWRKAERIATTNGYAWLDEHLGPDGRLRGAWTGCDGAAGRMTASSGLHNMPAVLRPAVRAEDGHLLVRADLGQIEPRVLAAVSGDAALIAATAADDMYLPVATGLGVDRPTAKVAMIAAMYGQTTGHGGTAARRMRAAYPVAMGYLDAADQTAQAGHDLRTYGGRLVRMSGGPVPPAAAAAAREAARGRYGRNAVVQGAAAELFKMWAVTVRARGGPLGARIVLCLHDELLVHVPADRAEQAARLVGDCLAEAARHFLAGRRDGVRFIADIKVVSSWADAKA